MADFGPAPINAPCPDCGVFPVDGYMSHLTSCPQRRMEKASFAPQPPVDRWKPEPSRLDNVRDWAAWHWRQLDWRTLLFVLVALTLVAVVVWFALEGLEELRGRY